MVTSTSSRTSQRKDQTLWIDLFIAGSMRLVSKNNRFKSHNGRVGHVVLSMRNIRNRYTRDRESIEAHSTPSSTSYGYNVADGYVETSTFATIHRKHASSFRIVSPQLGYSLKSEITSIQFPSVGTLRWRDVVSRSQSRPAGKYPSLKMGRMLQWESRNELNAFRLLDCSPQVSAYTEQPCKIEYTINGVSTYHVPDILIELNGHKELWEVKPDSKAVQPDIAERTVLLTQHLPSWGYSYRVVLGSDLASQPRLRNTDRLLQLGRDSVTDCEQEFIRRLLKESGELIWSEACAGTYGARGRQVLCRMVIDGTLSIDMNKTWTPNTEFIAEKEGL